MERYIESAANLSQGYSPQCAGCLRAFNPFFAVMLQGLIWVVRLYAQLYNYAYTIYVVLPATELQMILGLILCFFGGTYVALIAAIEAFRTMGGEQLYRDLEFIWGQIELIWEEHRKDDLVDADNDGIADVDQTQLQSALVSLWSACLGVLATLKLQFAQTVGYALALSGMVLPEVCRLSAPALGWMLGADLQHWVETIISTAVMVVCVLLVWWLAKVRAAFYSGLRGGRVFADALVDFLEQRSPGCTSRLPECLASRPSADAVLGPDTSRLEQMIAYPLAMLGFGFQVSSFFMLPFPLDWVLWPVSLAEAALEVQISWS